MVSGGDIKLDVGLFVLAIIKWEIVNEQLNDQAQNLTTK